MSKTKVHGAVVVENGLLDAVRNEIEGSEIPGGRIVKEYVSTMEEVEKTVPNGYVLAKYHQEVSPIYTTIVFEYSVSDPQSFANDMFAPVKYLTL